MHPEHIGYMGPKEIQLANEHIYNRRFIDGYIQKEIPENMIDRGMELLGLWMDKEYYPSKNERIEQLQLLDERKLVLDVLTATAYCQTQEQFTTVSAMLAGRLKFDEKSNGILTAAEILAVLCDTDAYDIIRDGKNPMVIISRLPLSTKLLEYVANSQYLPPLVCEPEEVTSNSQSGYLTHDESIILGKGNHHEEPLALDVINRQNKVALLIDIDFIRSLEEVPNHELDTPEKLQSWEKQLKDSVELYGMISQQATSNGGRIHFDHGFDKRGRLYCRGYHITYQGTPYKKAMLELAQQEFIEVPEKYMLAGTDE